MKSTVTPKVEEGRGPWILMSSGRLVYPLDMRPEDIYLDDVAHSLARQCRYNGHVNCDNYSVAQHSVITSLVVPKEYALVALLHDVPEYITGDFSGPIKPYMPQFRDYEDNVWKAVALRFGLSEKLPDEVKHADWQVLLKEMELFFPVWPGDFDPKYKKSEYSDLEINPLGAREAELAFKVRYLALTMKEVGKKKNKTSKEVKVGKAAA